MAEQNGEAHPQDLAEVATAEDVVVESAVSEVDASAFPTEANGDEDFFPEDETEFKISARVVGEGDAEANIFRRNSDPFADDFFNAEQEQSGPWDKPFDSFTFSNDQ